MITAKRIVLPQTDEEIKAVEELLTKMRKETRRKEDIQRYTGRFKNVAIESIDTIGLEETKRIIRNLNKSLRMSREENHF